jgi:phosphoribosylanthranilate isomerase
MRDGDNIRQVAELGVDWIGFIFYHKSPRYVTMLPTRTGIMPDRSSIGNPQPTRHHCRRVGVFVDEMAQNIITRAVNFQLDAIQMHGHESPTLIRNLRRTLDPDIRPGIEIWKAIGVKTADDLKACLDYEDSVDLFVLDTKCDTGGGSGRQFDWSLLDAYPSNKPFLLSGGIGPDDAVRISQFHHQLCIGVDLNSRFETAPGIKDIQKLQQFISQLT